jgi:hypothetical protein
MRRVVDEELCAATTRRGERCPNPLAAGQWFCAAHLAAPAVATWGPAEFRRKLDALRERLKARRPEG